MINIENVKSLIQDTVDNIEIARKAPWDTDALLNRLVIRLELLRDMLSAFPDYYSECVIEAFVSTKTNDEDTKEENTDAE